MFYLASHYCQQANEIQVSTLHLYNDDDDDVDDDDDMLTLYKIILLYSMVYNVLQLSRVMF